MKDMYTFPSDPYHSLQVEYSHRVVVEGEAKVACLDDC